MKKMELYKLIRQEGDLIDIEHKGYRCKIKRNKSFGHLCGYVQIPRSSPMWGMLDSCETLADIDVHGGINFGWHLENESDYWVGFSCDQSYDLLPNAFYNDGLELENITYRTVDYVQGELMKLVDQLITKESEQ